MKYYVKTNRGEVKVEHLEPESVVPIAVQAGNFRDSVFRHGRPFGNYIVKEWFDDDAYPLIEKQKKLIPDWL
tara:strand:+ start:6366 stop:6581 length:216 start_codon:yes stop_codon:yes gene_type:complete